MNLLYLAIDSLDDIFLLSMISTYGNVCLKKQNLFNFLSYGCKLSLNRRESKEVVKVELVQINEM
jgi:hypothetical protein